MDTDIYIYIICLNICVYVYRFYGMGECGCCGAGVDRGGRVYPVHVNVCIYIHIYRHRYIHIHNMYEFLCVYIDSTGWESVAVATVG